MHEAGLMQEALEICFKHAAANGATRVTAIQMRVGLYAGVEVDALAFAFDALKSGTIAQSASLELEQTPFSLYCNTCGTTSSPLSLQRSCLGCGSLDTTVQSGTEMLVARIELCSGGDAEGAER